MTVRHLRTGRKVGRTIYAQAGPEPSDSDRLIGVMDTTFLARLVVVAVNEYLNREGDPAMSEPTLDNPATIGDDRDDDPQTDALYAAAAARDEDPDGDPDALDCGAAEEESDTDPEPLLNDDAADPLDDLDENGPDDVDPGAGD